jgi:hypothetical protein
MSSLSTSDVGLYINIIKCHLILIQPQTRPLRFAFGAFPFLNISVYTAVSPSDSFNAQAVHWARSKAQAHESSMQRQSCDLCVIFLSKRTNWTQNTQGYLRQDMFAHFGGGYTREPPVYSFSAFPFSLPLWTASQDSTAPSFSDCQILSIEHDNV